MRAVARVAVLTLATGLPRVPLAAQAGWEPPRLPCEVVPANSNVDNGIQFLSGAAEKPAPAAALCAGRPDDDSAFAYYRAAPRTVGDDAVFAHDRREALSNGWRLVVRKVQGHPAAQRAARVRASLDSMRRGLTNDSTVLARLVTSSQSRKA